MRIRLGRGDRQRDRDAIVGPARAAAASAAGCPRKPVPAGLHWDEWIGPAAYREYHEKLHPQLWRSWWEFGDGSVGDWGCHNLDGVFMALKLGTPTSVEALEQVGGSDERYPLRNVIRWSYPARGDMPPVKVHWYDGFKGAVDALAKLDENNPEGEHNRPPIVDELEKKYGRKLGDGGAIFVGDKGILVAGNYCGSPRLVPEEKQRVVRQAAATCCRAGQEGPDASDRLPPLLQGRQAGQFQLRLLRPLDRDGAAGLPGRAGRGRQARRVGCREGRGHQPARVEPHGAAGISQGLGIGLTF